MPRGRRAAPRVDTTPGRILALALLANAPIFVGFVLVPLFSGPLAARETAPYVLLGTPVMAVWSLAVWWRAPPERKGHPASRIGLLLDGVGLLLWALVLALTLA